MRLFARPVEEKAILRIRAMAPLLYQLPLELVTGDQHIEQVPTPDPFPCRKESPRVLGARSCSASRSKR